MQTFLPFADFQETARVLDNKRLGKQRVESLQILQALFQLRLTTTRESVYVPSRGKRKGLLTMKRFDLPRSEWRINPAKVGWNNHAATRMWRGHESAFMVYQFYICQEWKNRGYKDTCWEKSVMLYDHSLRGTALEGFTFETLLDAWTRKGATITIIWPEWLGDERLHSSHRSSLLRKDPDFYGKYGWTDDSEVLYFWPEGTR